MLDILIVVIFAIIIIPKIGKESEKSQSLDVSSSTSLKGISSIAILFNHFTGWFLNFGPIMFLCVHWGTQVVAVFFFLSSYGLYQKYGGKRLTISFLLKRFLKIFVSYWICELLYCVVSVFLHISIKTAITFKNIVFAFFGLVEKSEIVENAWFVTAIVVMYIIFFACSNLFPKIRLSIKILVVSLLFVLLTQSRWVSGFAAFLLGIVIAENEETFRKLLSKRCVICLIVSLIIIAITVILKFKGQSIENGLIMDIADYISSIFVPLTVYIIVTKIRIGNRITNFLGKVSYEIYLIHGLAIRISFEVFGLEKPIMFCLFSVVISLIAAVVINRIALKVEKPIICRLEKNNI